VSEGSSQEDEKINVKNTMHKTHAGGFAVDHKVVTLFQDQDDESQQ
jgi:hypothetical protein